MARVATYVYIDTETTGLPKEDLNKTRIIELSMVAVKRDHLLDTRPGSAPRVQHKLTLCFNPRKFISVDGSEISGLCNDLLENEPVFNLDVFNMINTFLNILSKPVCLIAHNGMAFDYPILKNHFEKLNVSLSEDFLCADSYHGFYDILEKKKLIIEANIEGNKPPGPTPTQLSLTGVVSSTNGVNPLANESNDINSTNGTIKTVDSPSTSKTFDEADFSTPYLNMQAINETTPKRNKTTLKAKRPSKACRRMPWGNSPKPKDSYKLKHVYERVLNKPAEDAHRAENDCIFVLEISAALSQQFVEWVDDNHVKFSEIVPMTIGVPLGF